MGVLPRIEKLVTGTNVMTIYRDSAKSPVRADLTKLFTAASDQHVEIMRDDLSEIYYDAGRDDVEYLFGDSITSVSPDGDVTFEHTAPGRFDVIVGADGLHSNVRQLVLGNDSVVTRFLGAYLAVASVPKTLAPEGELLCHARVGRLAAIYTAQHLDDARAVFLFNSPEFRYDYRDAVRQKELLRQAFAGMAPEVDTWLAQLDHTAAFYFDAITQLQLDSWSHGRVTSSATPATAPGPRSAAAPASRWSAPTCWLASSPAHEATMRPHSRRTNPRCANRCAAAGHSLAPPPKRSSPAPQSRCGR